MLSLPVVEVIPPSLDTKNMWQLHLAKAGLDDSMLGIKVLQDILSNLSLSHETVYGENKPRTPDYIAHSIILTQHQIYKVIRKFIVCDAYEYAKSLTAYGPDSEVSGLQAYLMKVPQDQDVSICVSLRHQDYKPVYCGWQIFTLNFSEKDFLNPEFMQEQRKISQVRSIDVETWNSKSASDIVSLKKGEYLILVDKS